MSAQEAGVLSQATYSASCVQSASVSVSVSVSVPPSVSRVAAARVQADAQQKHAQSH